MTRHSPVFRTLPLRLAAAFLALLAGASAHAASVTWTNTAGGDWNTAGNWSAGALPGALDIAWITNRVTGQTVNYDAPMAAASISNLVVANLSAGLGQTNTLNINAGGFNVYSAFPTTNTIGIGGILNVNSGGVLTFYGGAQTWLSGDSGNKGTMNIQGGIVSNWSSSFYVGQNGQGALNLLSGSFVSMSNDVRIGAAAPQGLVNIYGGSFVLNGPAGTFRIGSGGGTADVIVTITNGVLAQNISGGSIFVGAGSKRGILNVFGGTVTNKGDLSIGMGAVGGTTGLVVMTGGLFIQQGNMILGRPSAITDNTVGLFNMGGGVFSNTGALYLGANRFGPQVNGFLTMTGGTWYQAGTMEVGSSLGYNGVHTNGALGRIDINGGDFLASGASATFGRIANSTGTLSVAGGNFVLTNAAKTAVLNLGPVGSGTFILSNGTAWLDNLVATNSGGVVKFVGGTLNLRAANVTNATALVVGDGNTAATLNLVGSTYNLANGLVATNSGAIVIASNTLTLAGADAAVRGGSVLVQNGGATWSRPLTISGGSYVSKSGTNTFSSNATVSAGASFAADNASVATINGSFVNEGVAAFSNGLTVGAGGVFNVQTGGLAVVGVSSAFNVAGSPTVRGILNVNGGVLTNTGVNMQVGFTPGQGEVNVYDGALVDTVRIRLGQSYSGFLNLFGGRVETPWLSVGRSLGTSNVVNIAGGLMRITSSGGIGVGAYGAGYLNVSGGTITNAGILHLGVATDGGTTTGLVVQTAGNWVQSGEVLLGNDASGIVGVSGLGVYTLGGGSFANAGSLFLGSARYAAGQGQGFLSITGGVWNQSGNVVEIGSYIGGGGNWTNGSLGRVDVLGGSFNAMGASEVVWLGRANLSTGTVNVAGGAFAATNATGTAVVNVGSGGLGTFLLSNGTAFVDRLIATGGAYSVVNLVGGALDTRATTVSNGVQFVVGSGGAAAFNLRGGTHSFGNGLQVSAGSLLSVTNATATVAGTVTNLGTVSVLNGSAIFRGDVVNLGAYVSDPSTNTFSGNLTVGTTGYLSAAAGDIYAVGGNFTMQSTNTAFNLSAAKLVFGTNGYGLATTTANHTLDVSGSGAKDIGTGYASFSEVASNFAIGTLSIATSNRLTLTGTLGAGSSNALYVGLLDIAWASTNNFTEVTNSLALALNLPDINLYYDAYNPQNAWLLNNTPSGGYNLWGGGLLLPIPEPSTAALFALLAGVVGLRRLRRRA